MLATSARFLFSHTFVTTLTTCWLSVAYVIIRGWPISTVTTVVPRVASLFLPIDTTHFIPPSSVRNWIIALSWKMSRYMLSGRIGVWGRAICTP